MSFRNRLTLFFVAIVIVPMVSVAFVLFSLISDNEDGKADARLAARSAGSRDGPGVEHPASRWAQPPASCGRRRRRNTSIRGCPPAVP